MIDWQQVQIITLISLTPGVIMGLDQLSNPDHPYWHRLIILPIVIIWLAALIFYIKSNFGGAL